MSDNTISQNREDYPIDIQILLGSIAKGFRNGDVDSVWAEYFDGLERGLARPNVPPPQSPQSRLQLRFPPTAQPQ